MHPILTSAKIHGTHGQALDDGPYLIQRQSINSIRVTITKGAGEIAFISQAYAERETSGNAALTFR